MSAAELPKLTLRYAFQTPCEIGSVYDSPHAARVAAAQQPLHLKSYPLLRLFVLPDGKIIHTEVVA